MRWYRSGQVLDRGKYKNDLLDGLYESFNEDGSPAYKVTYKEGKRYGKEYRYGVRGKEQVRTYQNGKLVKGEE